ncbi:MAG: hypothetical protein ACR2IV_03295 [Bryobacteraceae bacterium]
MREISGRMTLPSPKQRRLHLSPNNQKSRILRLDEARRHYHLDLNGMLDDAESLAAKASNSKAARLRFQRRVRLIWKKAQPHEGIGEFSKVLKRVYRLAGLAQSPLLRGRAGPDILSDPSLVGRIADYYRCTGAVNEYLDFVEFLMENPEQIYPDVNVQLTESLLRLEPEAADLERLRQLTVSIIRIDRRMPGSEDCATAATLLVLRYGDARTRRLLKRLIEDPKQSAPRHVVRAAAFVYASESVDAYQEISEVASRTLRNHLSTLVRLIAAIRDYKEVPERYRNRLNVSSDSVAGVKFVDMRVILTARLLLLSQNKMVRHWVTHRCKGMLGEAITDYDRALLRRLIGLGTPKKK